MNGGPELDPKLAKMLAEEARATDFPEARREELFAKIAGALPAASPGGAPTPGEAHAPATPTLPGAKLLKAGALIALGATLGYVARGPGALVTATAPAPPASTVAPLPSRPPEGPVEHAPSPAAPASLGRIEPMRPALPPPAPPAAASTSMRAPAPTPSSEPSSPSRGSTLAEERAIVERARAAIARRDGLSALEALAEHERAFATGKLAEERDALAVHALALAGRGDDARRRARDFERRYPGSIFTSRVEATLGELP